MTTDREPSLPTCAHPDGCKQPAPYAGGWCSAANHHQGLVSRSESELSLTTRQIRGLVDGMTHSEAQAAVWDATEVIDELRAEVEGYRNGNRDLHDENQRLRVEVEAANKDRHASWERAVELEAEVERMRPVVEAAIAASDGGGECNYPPNCEDPHCLLEIAIAKYQEPT